MTLVACLNKLFYVELLTPTSEGGQFHIILNKIVVSGWYVSFASIVWHAMLPDWSRRMQKIKQ